jgi:hypothetical protein
VHASDNFSYVRSDAVLGVPTTSPQVSQTERDLHHIVQRGERQLGGHEQNSPDGRFDLPKGHTELDDVARGRGEGVHWV